MLPPLPITSMPPSCHRPHSVVPSPTLLPHVPGSQKGTSGSSTGRTGCRIRLGPALLPRDGRCGGGSQQLGSVFASSVDVLFAGIPVSSTRETREELPEWGGWGEPILVAGWFGSSRMEPPGPRSPLGMGPALGRREPAVVGDGECLQRSGLWLSTSPASHLGLSLQGAVSGPGNSLPPSGADCLGEPKRGEWIWHWQPERAEDLAASVPTQGPSRPLPGAVEGPWDGSFPFLLLDAFGAAGPDGNGLLVGLSRGGGSVFLPRAAAALQSRRWELPGCLHPGLSIPA